MWKLTSEFCPKNAKYAAELSKAVYDDNIVCDAFFEDNDTDTQAAGIVGPGSITIVFRGTESIQDWLQDAKFRKEKFEIPKSTVSNTSVFTRGESTHWNWGRVHRGFLASIDSVWPQIREFLRQKYTGQAIFLCGHSLGAALAQLLAAWLSANGYNVKAVYTFGSPRVGNRKFARMFDQKVRHYRFVNNNDVVTRVPGFLYRHTGVEYYFNAKGFLDVLSFFALWIDRLRGRWYSLKARFRNVFKATDGIEDHMSARYVENVDLIWGRG